MVGGDHRVLDKQVVQEEEEGIRIMPVVLVTLQVQVHLKVIVVQQQREGLMVIMEVEVAVLPVHQE